METSTAVVLSPNVLLAVLLVLVAARIVQKAAAGGGLTAPLPPGPWKLPIIGSLHHLSIGSAQPHRRLWALAKKHGPLMHLQLGQIPTVVVSSADIARDIMKTHDLVFCDRPQILAGKVFAYGCRDVVCAPYGDYWRTAKKMCILELLSVKRVRSYRHIREEEVGNLLESVSQAAAGSPINISDKFFTLASIIASQATFGAKSKHQKQIVEAMNDCVRLASGFNFVDLFPSLEFLASVIGTKRTFKELFYNVDGVLDEIIREHKYAQSEGGTKAADNHSHEGGEEGDDDLLDLLLRHLEHQDLGFPFTITDIKGIIMDMFTAGTDTSATTLEWAMSELVRNPKVMATLQSEIRRAFEESRKMDESVVTELPYLKLVVKETLRLHPPAPLLVPRESREACTIDGYTVPVKTRVIVNAWALGRDPNSWVNPDTFQPERFLDGLIDFRGTSFEYVPFGAGRRICPGISFALAIIELSLAKLLCYFDWDTPDGVDPQSLDMDETFGATAHRKVPLCLMVSSKFSLPNKSC